MNSTPTGGNPIDGSMNPKSHRWDLRTLPTLGVLTPSLLVARKWGPEAYCPHGGGQHAMGEVIPAGATEVLGSPSTRGLGRAQVVRCRVAALAAVVPACLRLRGHGRIVWELPRPPCTRCPH